MDRRYKTIWKKVTALFLSAAMLIPTYGCVRGSSLSQKKDSPEFQAYYEPLKASEIAEEDGVYYVSGQILLTAAEGASYKDIEKLVKENGGEIIGYISATGDYQIRFSQIPTLDALDTLSAKLLENALVDEAMPAYAAQFTIESVNYSGDPWIITDNPKDTSGSVWDEEKPDGNNWWAEAIGMPTVWGMDLQTQTVKVGIIDTMFDTSNPDLDEGLFVKTWFNPENEDGSCRVPQEYQAAAKALEEVKKSKDKKVLKTAETRFTNTYHGTHVAGIIAAQANNGFGITGINQNVQLYGYALKSEEADASAEVQCGTIFNYKCAIAHLLNEGVKVINLSMGINDALVGTQDGDAVWSKFISVNSAALESFLLKYIEAGREFLIVKSAGNDSSENKKYDPKFDLFGSIQNEKVADRILIVGAAKYNRNHDYYSITDFSNAGSRVDVYAPGQSVLSDLPDRLTGLLDGTSMAAPIVTGLVSLIWGINPDLSAEQVREIIHVSTSATIFNLDRKLVRDLFFLFTDPTAIVNAPICVSLAQATVGSGYTSDSEYGTINGMVYALNAEQSDFVDMELQSFTLFNKSGEATAVPVQDIAYKVPDSQTGNYRILNLKSYSLLLAPGTYTLRAEAVGYDPQEQTITVKPGEVITADFKFGQSTPPLLTEVKEFDGAGNLIYDIVYHYDEEQRLVKITYQYDYYNRYDEDLNDRYFTYDNEGHLISMTSPHENVHTSSRQRGNRSSRLLVLKPSLLFERGRLSCESY